MTIAEVLDTQAEIIKLQSDIIDRLSADLLQHQMINETDLNDINAAAKMVDRISAGGEV